MWERVRAEELRIGWEYHGGSFVAGGIAVMVWHASLSPWWLLAVPIVLIDYPLLKWRWKSAKSQSVAKP